MVGFAPWNWVIGTGVYIDDLKAQAWVSTQRALIAAGVIVLFILAVSIFVARSITAPLQRMTVTMNDLAGGNLDVEVPGIGRGDEVGEMAKAVEVFKSNAVARQSLEAEQRAAETRAVASRKADMHKMADDFEGCGRPNRRDRFVGLRSARGLGGYAHGDRRTRAATRDHGRGGLGRGFDQRAVGGIGHRRDGLFRHRDQPSGPAIGADGQ